MKIEKLQNAINMLDDELITEADKVRTAPKKSKKHTNITKISKYLSVAACFCLLIALSLLVFVMFHSGDKVTNTDTHQLGHVNKPSSTVSAEVGQIENATEKNTASGPSLSVNKSPYQSSDLIGVNPSESKQNSTSVKPIQIVTRDISDSDKEYYYNFAVDLYREVHDGENTSVSPLSVYIALAMLANGAEGESLSQLEDVLGMTRNEINSFIHSYMITLKDSESSKLKLANSVWFTDKNGFKVNDTFLKTNANYYSANIFYSSFDNTTVKDINNWVNENTDGMIKEIIDEIDPATVMIIINALSFDAEWQTKYFETSIKEGYFHNFNNEDEACEYMSGTEHLYLEDENSRGFVKYYKDRNYAFVALLPDENMTLNEYVKSLNGEKIMNLFATMQEIKVNTQMPKFKNEYECNLADTLKSMGITDVFDINTANLSSIGTSPMGNLYLSRAIHKTFIEVNEAGTKAGAATILDIMCGSSPPKEERTETVNLNRPFVYMIIDCQNNMPIFIGDVSSIS